MNDLFKRADISRLVNAFYTKVRQDDLLAPVFASKIPEDHWPAHMAHITNFWSSILLKTGGFDGNPMRKHFGLNGLTPQHFTRWLALFAQAANDTLTPPQAKAIHDMASRIAQSFQMGLAFNYENTGREDNPFAEFGIRRSHGAG